MGVVLLLVLLALIIGGIGLAVEGLIWLLIIAGALLLVGAVMGFGSRSRSSV